MRRTLLAAGLLVAQFASSQGTQPWTAGVRGSWGALSPHHVSMWFLVERHALMGEFFVEHPFSGSRDWQRDVPGASWGLGLMCTDAGSPHQLGVVVRLLPYLTLPLHRWTSFSINARFGWGLGFVAEPFDRRDHFQQNVIGSRLNGAVLLAVEVRRELGRCTIGAGLSLDHLSNGAFQMPNLGVNLVTGGISVRYQLGKEQPPLPEPGPSEFDPHFETCVVAAWGMQEVYPLGNGKQQVISLSAALQRRVTPRSGFSLGMDLFNKGSLRLLDPDLRDRSRLGITQVGAHLGYALWLGGFCVVIDQGAYLYTPFDEKSFVWQRIGMRQMLGERWSAGLTLKTHFGQADHFELGIGYRIT